MSHDAMHAAMMRISRGLAATTLRPLPTVTHSIGAIGAALRQMSQARHIGKIVVRARTLQETHKSNGVRKSFSFAALVIGQHPAMSCPWSRRRFYGLLSKA